MMQSPIIHLWRSVLLCCLANPLFAQTEQDSTRHEIAPVKIRSYFSSQPFLAHTSSAKVITRDLLTAQMPGTILPAVNTTPGVRMEERSPGSYRLALRGSMLRSPFGVRNTKIYIDEIPLTDAGGNSYLNSLDPVGLQQITIIKGPDGSLFGPNSGGVVRISPYGFDSFDPATQVLISGGSFGTLNQQLSHRQQVSDTYQFSFDQAYMRSDGYRDHTGMKRLYLQTAHQWQYHPKAKLKFLAIYSDLSYNTPGGLTQAQFDANPQQARPATATMPGAEDQQATIYNKTLISGLVHEYKISDQWLHSASVFGSFTDFQNPFITNYEHRDERNAGFRTYVSYTPEQNDWISWQMQLGMEAQSGWYKIENFDNLAGVKGDPLSFDDLRNGQHFYFYRAAATILQKLTAEASIGLNYNDIRFTQRFPVVDNNRGNINFGATWMPRLALSYLLTPQVAARASVSRGYSPPTIAEVRSSDNQINADLQAEGGYNYEVGVRAETKNRRWLVDLSAYHYRLKEGIVRQLRENGAEFFVNAGNINQRGIELLLMGQLITPRSTGFIRAMNVSAALTYQDYKFQTYTVLEGGENVDHSGNKVTSIPTWISVNSLNMQFPHGTGINIMHNHTSSIPLNDANTAFANGYNLLQAKAHWQIPTGREWQIQVFVGGDNLLNQTYSLGNDINAFGGRYFNPSPTRNFYGGLSASF